MKSLYFLFAVMLVWTAAVRAETEYTNLEQCAVLLEQKGQQPANYCVAQVYKYTDKILNKIWQELLPKLSARVRKATVAAQRTWIQFRDQDCEAAGLKFEGGSLQPFEVGTCKIEHTNTRIKQLEAELGMYNNT